MTHTDLRAAREALGLTQQAMADLLGLDLSAYQRYETDPARASARAIHPTAARVVAWMLAPGRPPEWPAR
jgi:transcriptional regulator with XRE-family HTH domain